MLFTNALTLKFSEQFHVIRKTIFHTKHVKFLLKEFSCKYANFLASETCYNSLLHAKDFFFVKIHKRCQNFTNSDTVSYSFIYHEILFWGFVEIPTPLSAKKCKFSEIKSYTQIFCEVWQGYSLKLVRQFFHIQLFLSFKIIHFRTFLFQTMYIYHVKKLT